MKVWKIVNLFNFERKQPMRFKTFNCWEANPDKFQAIAVGNKTHAKTPVFKIESAEITCDEVVKLLGIDIDYQLNFNYHIKNICRKASQQHNYHLHKTRCYRQHNYTMYHIQ
jgi:hypothetical protein